MSSIKLRGEALRAYEAFLLGRLELEEQADALEDRIRELDEAMFHRVAELAGLDLGRDWRILDEFYPEFGVVLAQEIPDLPETFEAPRPPERPALMN